MPRPGQSPKRQAFTRKVSRARKATLGRTQAGETPLSIRLSGIATTPDLDAYMRQRAGFKLGKFAPRIERVTVRFKDVNGPRGGTDTLCRIKVVLSSLPSVVVEELASAPAEAFDRAADRIERVVRRDLGRARDAGKIRRLPQPRGPVVSASARTEVPSTAARNLKLQTRKATAALEDSQTGRPSRKSTRGSANRAKQGSKLQRREMHRMISPKSKARRKAARQRA